MSKFQIISENMKKRINNEKIMNNKKDSSISIPFDANFIKGKNSHEKKTKAVYIVLTLTGTYISRIIKLYTGEPYSHASIAFDQDLYEMYSFARKKVYNPFSAGFVREDLEQGVFGVHKKTTCSIYKLMLTDKQYNRVRTEVDKFKDNADWYTYSYLGLFGLIFNIPRNVENKFYCSQFVGHTLEKSGMKLFTRDSALIRPFDLRTCSKLQLVYEGKLRDYRNYIQGELNLYKQQNA